MTKMILEGIVSKKYKFTTFNSNFYHEKVSEDIPFVFFPGKLGAGKKNTAIYTHSQGAQICKYLEIRVPEV